VQVYAHHERTRRQGRPSPDPKNWAELVAVWLKSIEVGVGGLNAEELLLYEEYLVVTAERDRRGKELHTKLDHQREVRDLTYKLNRLHDSRTLGAGQKPNGV